jgi:hypothetical protein
MDVSRTALNQDLTVPVIDLALVFCPTSDVSHKCLVFCWAHEAPGQFRRNPSGRSSFGLSRRCSLLTDP